MVTRRMCSTFSRPSGVYSVELCTVNLTTEPATLDALTSSLPKSVPLRVRLYADKSRPLQDYIEHLEASITELDTKIRLDAEKLGRLYNVLLEASGLAFS